MKYSFSIGGFWFHLRQITTNNFQDQNGCFWMKQGNQLLSEGGNYIHVIKPEDSLGNKDYSQLLKQRHTFSEKERESYYHQRLMITKGFC